MSKSIEVNDLNVYYGKFKAVEDVNLRIEPRTVTAFIGPSGCGKSTFLRTLNRMHEVIPGAHVEGEVLIDGNNLYGPGVDPVLVRPSTVAGGGLDSERRGFLATCTGCVLTQSIPPRRSRRGRRA